MQECRPGYYCPGAQANFSIACPNQTYSLAGSDDIYDCSCPENSISQRTSQNITQCVCMPSFYKELTFFNSMTDWRCRPCLPGQYCFDTVNVSCPAHAFSFPLAKSYLDCFCREGFKNATNRTEENFCEVCPVNNYCTGLGKVQSCVPNAISPIQSGTPTACTCGLGYKGLNNTPCTACQSPQICYAGLEGTCPEGTFSPPLAWDRLNCSCLAGKHSLPENIL